MAVTKQQADTGGVHTHCLTNEAGPEAVLEFCGSCTSDVNHGTSKNLCWITEECGPCTPDCSHAGWELAVTTGVQLPQGSQTGV